MKLLLIHQNLPAQFKHLIQRYARDPEHQVVGICQGHAPSAGDDTLPDGVVQVYKPKREPTADIHPYLYSLEAGVLNGQAVAARVHELDRQGFTPDLTLVHPGWGEGLYIKDVLPDRPLIGFFEFFYRARGLDADFDPDFPVSKDDELRIRTRNALHLLSLDACDAGISSTAWQRQVHPPAYHSKITVLHEGIDTRELVPNPAASFELPDGTVLHSDMEVVTFVTRSLEPYRGFHVFMRALPAILRRRPGCRIVIVGGDDVAYGRRLPEGQTWREKMLAEVDVDPNRVHFLGPLPWAEHVRLLQTSAVHVYLTVPFVLSWSMLEAMSAGCAVIGSDTAPVREVLQHGRNGLLVDFFSKEQLADAVDDLFDHPRRRQALAAAGRQTVVAQYDARDALVRYEQYFKRVLRESR
ncbi:MAG: glycosyltransferase family 4 protein [Anaerolineae bacterium]